jgi:hypothetical protein
MKLLLTLIIGFATTLGCASWHGEADTMSLERALPPPKRETGSAILEIAFISIGKHAEVEQLWRETDQTLLPTELRHDWERNGMRIGKVQKTLDFENQLSRIRRQPEETASAMEATDVHSDLSHQSRRITCRVGKRYELPVRQPSPDQQTVLVRLGNETRGRTLARSQPLFALRATSADVHSIALSLRPEVQHGDMRQTWVGSDAALRLDNRRESWNLDELTTEVRLEKGAVLVVGGVDPPLGIGRLMFTGLTAEGDEDRVLMILRVAELPELTSR